MMKLHFSYDPNDSILFGLDIRKYFDLPLSNENMKK